MSLSEYSGNGNTDPGDQSSNKKILVNLLPATRVTVGIISTLLIQYPSIYRWILIKNRGVDSIWLGIGTAAIVGVGTEIAPGDNYFLNPIPFLSVYAISENAPNTRIILSVL